MDWTKLAEAVGVIAVLVVIVYMFLRHLRLERTSTDRAFREYRESCNACRREHATMIQNHLTHAVTVEDKVADSNLKIAAALSELSERMR